MFNLPDRSACTFPMFGWTIFGQLTTLAALLEGDLKMHESKKINIFSKL
jgi:hypothetical protein